MEVDATVTKRKNGRPKDFENLIDMEFIEGINLSKIFKKQFINKLEKMGSNTFGLIFTLNDSAIMIAYNRTEGNGIYISIPTIGEKTKKLLTSYLDITFKEGGGEDEEQDE